MYIPIKEGESPPQNKMLKLEIAVSINSYLTVTIDYAY